MRSLKLKKCIKLRRSVWYSKIFLENVQLNFLAPFNVKASLCVQLLYDYRRRNCNSWMIGIFCKNLDISTIYIEVEKWENYECNVSLTLIGLLKRRIWTFLIIQLLGSIQGMSSTNEWAPYGSTIRANAANLLNLSADHLVHALRVRLCNMIISSSGIRWSRFAGHTAY